MSLHHGNFCEHTEKCSQWPHVINDGGDDNLVEIKMEARVHWEEAVKDLTQLSLAG